MIKKYKQCSQNCFECPYDDCYINPALLKSDPIMKELFKLDETTKKQRLQEYRRKYWREYYQRKKHEIKEEKQKKRISNG